MACDEVLRPLGEAGCVRTLPLGEPSPAASPVFVVYIKGKPRVVVDLRKVNARLRPDAYPLPKQDDILGALGGAGIFTSLDITKSFFQQRILESDQWKTAFVTPHRGQEVLTVSTMGLANSPGFFQHRMEDLLRRYLWDYVLVYIDDVVIFSRTPDEHIDHLEKILSALEESSISLSPAKYHFAYPSIKLLGHEVSRLGIATAADKVEAIRRKAFPENLHQLETGLGLFGYYRKYVLFFSAIAEPLQKIKT